MFPFLAARYRGRRKALKEFTHFSPDFVFWVSPEGNLIDARDSHRRNPPRNHEHILRDEPHYGGFLRGRVATSVDEDQLVVVYCLPELLATHTSEAERLLKALAALPVPLADEALVVSDNADIYGTIADLIDRRTSLRT